MIPGMRKEYASLRRRMFLTPVWISLVVGVIALAVATWAVLAASTTVIVVVRHAEKTSDAGPDPALSPAGVERAARLAALFAGAPGAHGLDAIFVTQWRRTGETARPLATASGIPVITLPAEDVDTLSQRILDEYRGRRVLVIGHADSVPELVRRLARGSTVASPAADEYGTAYIVAVPRWGRPNVLRLSLP
jgi:broad specificity phosphatase PhoE